MNYSQSVLPANNDETNTYQCQYLVIGSGAGGSVSGTLLAEAGKDVIILEAGPFLQRSDFTTSVSEMTAQLYRNRGVFPFLGSPTIAFAEGNCVGGGTVINGGLIWRTPTWILQEWQTKHGLKDYGREELDPYFDIVEKDLHVVKSQLDDTANLDSLALWRGSQELGWKTVLVPRAVKNCINENHCPTGCIAGSKQSMIETYIPRALNSGARLLSNTLATKINYKNRRATSVTAKVKGPHNPRRINIKFDFLFLAGGPVQSAHLLKKSGISKRAGNSLQFHINLKFVAIHKEPVHAEKGTIFTVQVQEFEEEGTLIMASNIKRHYTAMTLSHFSNQAIDDVLSNYDKTAIYVTMIKPESKAHIISRFGEQPLVWYQFNKEDLSKVKSAIRKTCRLLFASGVEGLYLPIIGTQMIRSMDDVETIIEGLTPRQLEMISVHAMSSCPMGVEPSTSVVNPEGRLWDLDNVFITDASILPSNIGESPQGTIMAFAHKIGKNHLSSIN